MAEEKSYPQDTEVNEYRYTSPAWLDAVAEGLTKGAVKHPGETWRQIPADEHLARAMRHINLYRMGDRGEPHLVNASMRLMMAFETSRRGGNEMKQVKKVYICSRYRSDERHTVKNNIGRAYFACGWALDHGYAPFAPHLIYPHCPDGTPKRDTRGDDLAIFVRRGLAMGRNGIRRHGERA